MSINKEGREALQFSDALAYLQRGGQKLSRAGWNGDNMFIYWVDGSTFEVNRAPLLGIYPDGQVISYQPHIDMAMPNGDVTVWQPSLADICASDWFIVSDDEVAELLVESVGDDVVGDGE